MTKTILALLLLTLPLACDAQQQNPVVIDNLQYGDLLYPYTGYDGLDISGVAGGSPGIARLFPNGTNGSSLEFYSRLTTTADYDRLRIDGNLVFPNRYTFVSEHTGSTGTTGPIVFRMDSTDVLTISPNGNVGIGLTNPGADLVTNPPPLGTPILEVHGDIALAQGTGGQVIYSDGTVQSTAWNGVLSGGDYAESVDVGGDRASYEPGDVIVIDPSSEGNFLKSSVPYSTAVTGVYSTKPGVVGRRQLSARVHMREEVPMAMTGIVPIKVSAENGPIKPGDLLVTSSKSGYAMKGTDHTQMFGAVIGKAIGHLDSGLGVVEAVITLQ